MYKSKLQELCQRRSWELPEYTTTKDGPDHMPRFTAAVNVHDQVFETPAHCKSAKEAQNTAARIAFDHFTAIPPLSDLPPSTLAPAAAVDSVAPPVSPQPEMQPVAAAPPLSPLPSSLPIPPPDRMHLYKNQLQQYAQKENLGFPVYTSESQGPPHARRFKATVSINGKSYETLEFFPTLKEAERAAAKVACEVLSVDVIQEDGGLYKNLLQELALKKCVLRLSYETVSLGMSHRPTFVSTVAIGTETFRGTEAKTKKQAETNVAKVAYCALTEGSPAMESSEVSSITECPVADIFSQSIEPTATIETHDDVTDEEAHPDAKRAKFSPENTDENTHLLHPSHSDPPSDDSDLLYSEEENSASAEPVTKQIVKNQPMHASVEDSGFSTQIEVANT